MKYAHASFDSEQNWCGTKYDSTQDAKYWTDVDCLNCLKKAMCYTGIESSKSAKKRFVELYNKDFDKLLLE